MNNVYIIYGTRIFFLLLSISQYKTIFFSYVRFCKYIIFYVFYIIKLNNMISVFIFF